MWKRFEEAFLAAWGLVTYAPVFKDYFFEGLKQFSADNVMYLELRAMLPQVCKNHSYSSHGNVMTGWQYCMWSSFFSSVNAQTYELNGTLNDRFWTLGAYQEVLKRFVGEHPDFFGARVIFTVHR